MRHISFTIPKYIQIRPWLYLLDTVFRCKSKRIFRNCRNAPPPVPHPGSFAGVSPLIIGGDTSGTYLSPTYSESEWTPAFFMRGKKIIYKAAAARRAYPDIYQKYRALSTSIFHATISRDGRSGILSTYITRCGGGGMGEAVNKTAESVRREEWFIIL